MSAITLQSFSGLLGNINDGQFVINGQSNKEADLQRVNRGSNFFSRHFWYTQKDLTNCANDNMHTRNSLCRLLCENNGLDADNMQDAAVRQLRIKLGLNDAGTSSKPLNCRDVRKLLNQYTTDFGSPKDKGEIVNALRTEYCLSQKASECVPGFDEFHSLGADFRKPNIIVEPENLMSDEDFKAHLSFMQARIQEICTKGMDFKLVSRGGQPFKALHPNFVKNYQTEHAKLVNFHKPYLEEYEERYARCKGKETPEDKKRLAFLQTAIFQSVKTVGFAFMEEFADAFVMEQFTPAK